MPGFAPTQGHLASALCYLPHALDRLTASGAERVMLLAKGSLFLGQMCQLSDGMSVVLERNPGSPGASSRTRHASDRTSASTTAGPAGGA
jgi:betaine reductase